jgi:hypothetical protein
MKKLLVILGLLISTTALATGTASRVGRVDSLSGSHAPQNLLKNPDFARGVLDWVGSPAATVTGGILSWDSDGAGQSVLSTAVAIPARLAGQNGAFFCDFAVAMGTATHTIGVTDGTNALVTPVTITSSTTYTKTGTTFVFPTSGNVLMKILSVNANEPSIAVQRCFVGDAFGTYLSNVSQNKSTTVSYSGGVPSSDASWATSVTDTGTGDFTLNHADFGGVEVCTCTPVQSSAAIACPAISATATAHRFKVVDAAGNAVDENAKINCAPASSRLAVTPDLTPGSWSGYHTSACYWENTTTTSYVDFGADATCTLTERTNQNFGTVTTAVDGSANALPGITFTPKKAGRYLVRANAGGGNGSAGDVVSLELIQGTATVLDTFLVKANSNQAATTYHTDVENQGIVVASSTSPVTVKYVAKVSGATGFLGGLLNAIQITSIEWSIFYLDNSIPAPVLVNSVTSSYAGVKKNISATLNCDAGSAITSQDGTVTVGVAAIGNISTGVCAITMAGMGSTTPRCRSNILGTALDSIAHVNPTSATAVNLYCTKPSDGSALASCDVDVFCDYNQ